MSALLTPARAPGSVEVDAPQPNDARFWSVTTILGVLDKPGLIYWAAEETAKCALNARDSWQAIEREDGTEAALNYLTGARFRRPRGERSATALGNDVHAAIEEYTLTGKRPKVDDEVRPYLARFDEWCQRVSPSYEAAELSVYSTEYGYAGTADAFLTIDGTRLIADYKSTRTNVDKRGNLTRPYPEVALQLAAYRHADLAAVWRARRETKSKRYYYLSADERAIGEPVPEVDGAVCIHITPERCDAYAVRTDARVFDAFLYCLEVARWKFDDERTAIGELVG